MTDQLTLFEWVADKLTERTSLTQLEARGTLRLVLKHAGLDPKTVAPNQMEVVLQRLLPGALGKRRVDDAKQVCADIVSQMKERPKTLPETNTETAYDVFERLDSRKVKS